MDTICFLITWVITATITIGYGMYMYKQGIKYGIKHTVVKMLTDEEIIKEE